MLTSHEHTSGGGCGCGCGGDLAGPGALAALERPRWFARQIVGPEDLTQEQDHLRARMRRHNRMLHGWGVVCGLRVRAGKDSCEVMVEAGYALDPCGEEIVVPDTVSLDACNEDMDGAAISPCGGDPWCGSVRVERDPEQTYYLAIRHVEHPSRPVLAYGNGCGGDEAACEYSRVRDGYELRVLETLPEGHDELAPFADIQAAFTCSKGPRECPPCPTSTWVVLADLKVQSDRVAVDCFPHRRHVVSFADGSFRCDAKGATTVGSPYGMRKERSTMLVDSADREASEQPKASVAVKLPIAGLRTLPVHFEVRRGETYAELIAREGERTFTADSGEAFTLAEAYAVAGVDPATTVKSATDALRPLEALELRADDLRVTRHALEEILDDTGLSRLNDDHAGAPGRVLDLPATDLMGVSETSPLARRLDGLTVGDVTAGDREAFVAKATARASGDARERLRAQAETVWAAADRARRLASAWRKE